MTAVAEQSAARAVAAGEAPRRSAWIFAAACFLFFLGLSAAMFSFTAEDAYIIARYAENLVRGNGLVFNAGEQVNALTCPLMAILEAGVYSLTGATIVVTKVLSVVLVAAAFAISLERLRQREESIWLFAVLAVASPFLAFWAIGGMEAPLLLWLVTAAAVMGMQIVDNGIGAGSAAAVSLLTGLAFLTRQDSILFCGPVLLWLVVRFPRKAFWLLAPAAAIAGGWLAFAQWYYHDVLPTSFYVKKPIWRSYEVKRTAEYLLQFAVYSGWGLLAVWIAARLARGGKASRQAALGHVRRYWGLYLGLACFAVYAAMNATKHMMFSYRMIVPFVPAVGVLLLELHASARSGGRSPRSRLVAMACLAMLAVQGAMAWQIDPVSINPGFVGEYRDWSRQSYVEGFAAVLKESATAIRSHWQSQGVGRPPRIVTFAAGIAPYYLPEAYVYETLVSYRKGHDLDWRRAMQASDYQIVHTDPGETPRTTAADGSPLEATVIARYPFWFDGRWADLCVLYNPAPEPYPLPRFVDGPSDRH